MMTHVALGLQLKTSLQYGLRFRKPRDQLAIIELTYMEMRMNEHGLGILKTHLVPGRYRDGGRTHTLKSTGHQVTI